MLLSLPYHSSDSVPVADLSVVCFTTVVTEIKKCNIYFSGDLYALNNQTFFSDAGLWLLQLVKRVIFFSF